MPVNIEDNYQFSYQTLLLFLSRPEENGYVFCSADDYRFVPKITTNLVHDLELKGIRAAVIYLRKDTDEPIMYQIGKAAEQAGALIVANLYDIIDKTEQGLVYLTQLNFGRETLWQLNKPIVFWADGQSLNTIANHAPDLYSQRRHTAIHFTGIADGHVSERLQKDGWETFLSSQQFKDIETNIHILEKRLRGAEETNYPVNRIVTEIALALTKNYAQIGLATEAKELLTKYAEELMNLDDDGDLLQLSEIYYSLHDYNSAIHALRKANDLLASKHTQADFPERWFVNIIRIAVWSAEIGRSNAMIPELSHAASLLEKSKNDISRGRILAYIWRFLGDFYSSSGDLQKAKQYHEQALKLMVQLSSDYPIFIQIQRELGPFFGRIGDVFAELGNLPEAKQYYEQALIHLEKQSDTYPSSEQLKRELSVTLERLGDTLAELGNLSEAKQYYDRVQKLREELYRNNPYSEDLQRGLGISFNKLGYVLTKLDLFPEARQHLEQALKFAKQLSSDNPHSEALKRDLAVAYSGLGDVAIKEHKLESAKQYYCDSLRITKQLSIANPLSQQTKEDISGLEERIKEVSAQINLPPKQQ